MLYDRGEIEVKLMKGCYQKLEEPNNQENSVKQRSYTPFQKCFFLISLSIMSVLIICISRLVNKVQELDGLLNGFIGENSKVSSQIEGISLDLLLLQEDKSLKESLLREQNQALDSLQRSFQDWNIQVQLEIEKLKAENQRLDEENQNQRMELRTLEREFNLDNCFQRKTDYVNLEEGQDKSEAEKLREAIKFQLNQHLTYLYNPDFAQIDSQNVSTNETSQGQQLNSSTVVQQSQNETSQGQQLNNSTVIQQSQNETSQGQQLNSSNVVQQSQNETSQGQQLNSSTVVQQSQNETSQGQQLNNSTVIQQSQNETSQGQQLNSSTVVQQSQNETSQGQQLNNSTVIQQSQNETSQGQQLNSSTVVQQSQNETSQGQQLNNSTVIQQSQNETSQGQQLNSSTVVQQSQNETSQGQQLNNSTVIQQSQNETSQGQQLNSSTVVQQSQNETSQGQQLNSSTVIYQSNEQSTSQTNSSQATNQTQPQNRTEIQQLNDTLKLVIQENKAQSDSIASFQQQLQNQAQQVQKQLQSQFLEIYNLTVQAQYFNQLQFGELKVSLQQIIQDTQILNFTIQKMNNQINESFFQVQKRQWNSLLRNISQLEHKMVIIYCRNIMKIN